MSKDKHTPLPWQVNGGGWITAPSVPKEEARVAAGPYGDDSWQFYGGEVVAETVGSRDAELIVRAVNNLEAMRKLMQDGKDFANIVANRTPYTEATQQKAKEWLTNVAATLRATEPDYAAEFDRGPHGAAVERERENSVGCNQRDDEGGE